MGDAADERAANSARRLTRTHGALLRRWAGARRRSWGIIDTTTVDEIVRLLSDRIESGRWEPLSSVMRDVAGADHAVRAVCGVFTSRAPEDFAGKRFVGGELAMTIDEIHNAVRDESPALTREKLRKLLHKGSRRGSLMRVKRGMYIEAPRRWRRWAEIRDEEQRDNAFQERYDRRRFVSASVLLVHFLLPRLASYRKAKALGIAERTSFYHLTEVMADLEFYLQPRIRTPIPL